MGLIINGVIFQGEPTEATIKDMLDALNKIPQPEVIPIEKANVQQDEVVLAFQREILLIDLSDQASEVLTKRRLAGTKQLVTCVMICIFNKDKFLLVHLDATDIDLSVQLQQFKDTKNLKVMLLGAGSAMENQRSSQLAINNAKLSLRSLMKAAKTLKVDIEIVSQKWLSRNTFSDADKPALYYDLLISRAKILAKQFYNTELDMKRFSPAVVIPKFKVNSDKIRDVHIRFLTTMVFCASLYTEKSQVLEYLNIYFKKHIKSLEEFYQFIDVYFSLAGFKKLNEIHAQVDRHPGWSLQNFAIDLLSKSVLVIPSHISTPNECARAISSNTNLAPKFPYSYAWNPKTQQYREPVFYPAFLAACREVYPMVKAGKITLNEFLKRLNAVEYEEQFEEIYAFVMEIDKSNKVNKVSLFKQNSPVYKAMTLGVTTFKVQKSAVEKDKPKDLTAVSDAAENPNLHGLTK